MEKEPAIDETVEIMVNFAMSVEYDDLDDASISEAKRRLIDCFAIAFAGYDEIPSQIARNLALEATGNPGATVLGTRHGTTPELAALANGTMVHSQDYMDTYLSRESLHPSDTISAVLAAAECEQRSGKELLTGIVVAYEIMCRLADCANVRERGWDHVVFGCIASAIGCGKALRLSREQMRQAIGLAAVANTALRQTRVGEVPMWKAFAPSNAQRNGLMAARLAQRGVTGPYQAFQGEKGFERQVSGPLALGEFGSKATGYMINQTYIKVWPVQYNTQAGIQAALAIRDQIADRNQIEKISIDISEIGRILSADTKAKWDPQTRETADHSLPYIVVSALVDGQVDRSTFDEVNFRDPLKLDLVQKVEVRTDPQFTRDYPRLLSVRVEVQLKNGSKLSKQIDAPKGHVLDPLSDEEVNEKFQNLVEGKCKQAQINSGLRSLWHLEKCTSLRELMAGFAIE